MLALILVILALVALVVLGIDLVNAQKKYDAWLAKGAMAVGDVGSLLAWLGDGSVQGVKVESWPYWERATGTVWKVQGYKQSLLLFVEDSGRITTKLIVEK